MAVGEPGLIEAVTQADETSALNALMATRAFIQDTRDLVELLPVVYFDKRQDRPPDCPKYSLGMLVHEVLYGQSDWSDDEVSDLRSWLENNAGLQGWLAEYLMRLDEAIRTARPWQGDPLQSASPPRGHAAVSAAGR